MLALAVVGCGKKGPPLPPLSRVPAQVGNLAATRIGEDVYLSFTVPQANVDGNRPADLSGLDVYAVTATRAPETPEERKVATLVGTLPVRPVSAEAAAGGQVMPEPPPDRVAAPVLPPGVDQGKPAVFRETLTEQARVPVELPARRRPRDERAEAAVPENVSPFGPLVAPPPTLLPRRYYFVVAVNPRGRESPPSAVAAVPLEPAGAPPGEPQVTYTATALTIAWAPPPDRRTATLPPPRPVAAPPPPIEPVDTGGNQTPGNATPAAPVEPPVLPARSLGFTTVATTYLVYETAPQRARGPAPPAPEDPFALQLPAALTPQPLDATEFGVQGITFGVERCFEVRAVNVISGTPVQGPPSPRTCVTLADTFPPAAPRSLAAIAAAGAINLIWEPNTEPDLAGYMILRAEAPGDTLQPLTPAPIRETTFSDTTVRPGVRYVYAVVAADTADPPNTSAQSNRVEETARQ